MALTGIPASRSTRDRLRKLASKAQTYHSLLRRLLDDAEARLIYSREKRILESEEFVDLDKA